MEALLKKMESIVDAENKGDEVRNVEAGSHGKKDRRTNAGAHALMGPPKDSFRLHEVEWQNCDTSACPVNYGFIIS